MDGVTGQYPPGVKLLQINNIYNCQYTHSEAKKCYPWAMQQSSVRAPITADPEWRIGIVCSSYYKEEIEKLLEGARDVLLKSGLSAANVLVHWAPGSFEIPLVGSALAEEEKLDALLGLGIIVEGETHHARLLAEQAARGIMDVSLSFGIPFAFEILYVKTLAQAQERARGEQNKGAEAAYAVLQTLAELKRIRG